MDEGVEIYVVGITDQTNKTELREVSSPPRQENITWWDAPYFDQLDMYLQSLLKETCKEVCNQEKMTGKMLSNLVGESELVAFESHQVILSTDCNPDLVFIVDSSRSIRDADPPDGSYKNWDIILGFMNSIVSKFIIGPRDTQIGVVIFSDSASVYFRLNQYKTENQVTKSITSMPYLGGRSNTGAALRLAAGGRGMQMTSLMSTHKQTLDL